MLTPEQASWWQTTYNISYYILLAGLFVSFVATGLTFIANDRLATDLTVRLTATTKTAGEANERAAALEKEAANARLAQEKLQSANLETQKSLEQERLARIELQRSLAVREIAPERQRELVLALRDAHIKVPVVLRHSTDPEAASLGFQLRQIFSMVPFKLVLQTSSRDFQNIISGIFVSPGAGDAIAKILRDQGLVVSIFNQEPASDQIVVEVGIKPMMSPPRH